MQYELCYLVGESKSPDLEKIKEEVKNIVTREDARLTDPEFIEKRKLAYKVKGETRGIYVAQRFDVPSEDLEEKEIAEKNSILDISKKVKVNSNILRFIIVKTEDLPPFKKEESQRQEKESRPFPVRKKEVKKEKMAEKNIDEKLDELLNI